MKILVVITDGFEDIEAIGTIALLRRAKLDVSVAAINNTQAMGRYNSDLHGLKDLYKEDYHSYDALVIPGGPEYIAEEKNEYFLKMVKDFASEKKLIAAICAGPTILGHLGLLENRNYTCFTSMNEDFKGNYIDTYVVRDNNIITARSAAATIDFAFEIIKAIKGEEYMKAVQDGIYYQR